MIKVQVLLQCMSFAYKTFFHYEGQADIPSKQMKAGSKLLNFTGIVVECVCMHWGYLPLSNMSGKMLSSSKFVVISGVCVGGRRGGGEENERGRNEKVCVCMCARVSSKGGGMKYGVVVVFQCNTNIHVYINRYICV